MQQSTVQPSTAAQHHTAAASNIHSHRITKLSGVERCVACRLATHSEHMEGRRNRYTLLSSRTTRDTHLWNGGAAFQQSQRQAEEQFICSGFLMFPCVSLHFLVLFYTLLCLLDFTLACSLEHANALRRMRRAGDNTNTNTNTKHKKHNTHNGKRRNACHFIHTRQHTVCFTALHTASRYVWCASKGQDEAVVDFLLDGRAEQQLDELWT